MHHVARSQGSERARSYSLIEIRSDSSSGCFVDLDFDGHYYCVPKEGAENTKAIFSLLAQLIALRTPGDLAITPARAGDAVVRISCAGKRAAPTIPFVPQWCDMCPHIAEVLE